ncbi:MAG: cysteine desulfurase [Bacteroidetes bacterium]|nr:cysteine desulfurase [Bacteroidota bacterium]
MDFDIKKIRSDFPILSHTVYGKPLIYFDNAATTQKPECVINIISEFYKNYNSNVHRGVHLLSAKCTEANENARKTIQKFINANSSKEIIFTHGTTDSINLIATSFGDKFINKDDEIIVSELEHHSNIVPWQLLCERKQAKIKVLPFNEKGELIVDKLKNLISKKTKLITLNQVSNSLGTINPIKKIIEIAHSNNIPVMIDGAQAIQHQKVDVKKLDCDFYVFSGHKIYAPTGTGVLYGKEKWLEQMPPYQGGGDMIDVVTFKKTTYNELPFKFEAGTPNYIGNIALGKALDYVSSIGISNIAKHEKELLEYGTQKLSEIENLIIYGNAKNKTSVISFLINGIHPYDTGMVLDKLGVAVRTGNHCTQPVMDHYKIPGTVRASFAFYNTIEEIDVLYEGLLKVVKMFN